MQEISPNSLSQLKIKYVLAILILLLTVSIGSYLFGKQSLIATTEAPPPSIPKITLNPTQKQLVNEKEQALRGDTNFEKSVTKFIEICGTTPTIWDRESQEYAEMQCLEFWGSGQIVKTVSGKSIGIYTPDVNGDSFFKVMGDVSPLYDELNDDKFKQYLLVKPQGFPSTGGGRKDIAIYSDSKEVAYPNSQQLKTVYGLSGFAPDESSQRKRLEEIFEKLRSYAPLVITE